MYQYIISPYNNNKYSINKTIGRKILKKYINNLIGRGTNQLNRRIGSTAKYMNDLSNLKYFYTRGLLTCSFTPNPTQPNPLLFLSKRGKPQG